jgi:hypothetical protein
LNDGNAFAERSGSVARARREIAQIEVEILAGNPEMLVLGAVGLSREQAAIEGAEREKPAGHPGAAAGEKKSRVKLRVEAVGALPSLRLEGFNAVAVFFIVPAINPLSVCFCHSVFSMESTSKCT